VSDPDASRSSADAGQTTHARLDASASRVDASHRSARRTAKASSPLDAAAPAALRIEILRERQKAQGYDFMTGPMGVFESRIGDPADRVMVFSSPRGGVTVASPRRSCSTTWLPRLRTSANRVVRGCGRPERRIEPEV